MIFQRISIPGRSNLSAMLFFSIAGAVLGSAVIIATGQNAQQPGGQLRTDKAALPTAVNQPPNANVQMRLREKQTAIGATNLAGANTARRKQISDDTAKLQKLAADLNAEVDETSGNEFSFNMIRKVADIETLAHGVKEKMKLTAEAE